MKHGKKAFQRLLSLLLAALLLLPPVSTSAAASPALAAENTVQSSGREWAITPLITEDNAVTRNPDPEAPAAWGAVPDDAQLLYHEQELSAFIHFGVNTFTGAEWGTGREDPAVFNPTAMQTQEQADEIAERWVQAFQAGDFKRLILVGKHHDGFCIWPSAYTERDTDSSSAHVDVVWAVSKACTKYDMDMGFYLSPWDESAISYGYRDAEGNLLTKEQEAQMIENGELDPLMDYNEYYDAQLREILGNDKYGNNGKFVEIWMDGAKGSGAMAQDYDFSKWFSTIKELEPDARSFGKIAGSGIRWAGNEQGVSGADTCWMKMDIDANGELVPAENNKAARYLGLANGVIWSVNECDVSIRNGWFHGTQRDMDSLMNMYYNSVGHGSVLLLNVPPTTTGEFAEADVTALANFGAALRQTYATNFAAASEGATATTTQGTERASATAGKFSAGNVLDGDNDTYWTLQDGETSGQITIDLGQDRTFDLISLQEYIPLGQRIASTTVEYYDGTWHTFAEATTIGARRLVLNYPVTGSKVRVTVSNVDGCDGVPLLSSVGVYKASAAMQMEDAMPQGFKYIDDRDAAFSYTGSWTQWNGGDGLENTHTGTNTAGNTVTGTFTGTNFYIMGIVDPGHGPVEITIDGGEPVTFDTHADSRATKQILYASPDLEPGEHTIVMTAKQGTYNGINKTYFDFDGIYYVDGRNGILNFSRETYPIQEGESATVKITRTSGSEGDISFKVIDLPGSAVSGQHYHVVDETITLHDGETEATVTVNTILGDAANKQFYLQMTNVTGGALAGPQSTAGIRILDQNAEIVQEPDNGETFTEQDPFLLPGTVGQSKKLEAEYMELDSTGAAANSYVRISTDANASNGKKIDWFEENNKVYLNYYAPKAGVYTMTLRYQSGRSAGNLNTLNWRGDKVEDYSSTVPSTMSGGTLTYGEASYQFVVTEPGYGVLEFYADGQASPNIDWLTFQLDSVSVEKVSLDPETATITVGGTVTLEATVEPVDAENQALTWSSSDESVATVDSGVVTGIAKGTATITVTTEDGGFTAACEVTVTDVVPPAPTAPVTPPATTTTEIRTNEDGSVTTTVTDNVTGAVTETTVAVDGSKVEKVTTSNETVTVTVSDSEGAVLAKVEIPAEIPAPADRFVDVPEGHWANEAIHNMAALKVVNGVGGNRYDMNGSMTRGMLATVLFRLSNGQAGLDVSFSDVPAEKYYTDAVAWAAKAGVVQGVGDNEFAPDNQITREQLAVMLYRYARLLGMDTATDTDALGLFNDGGFTHNWAAESMSWCIERGIVQGKGYMTLAPTAPATRAEVAMMLQRFINLIK